MLIDGETGTGKTLVAHALHAVGSRAGKKFVLVSCSAFEEDALSKRLFGPMMPEDAQLPAIEEARGGTLVLEDIEGTDLSTLVKQAGPLEVDVAVDCICQAARGLQYLHDQGIFHRNVKPGNLLLDRYGTVHVTNMTLALVDEDADLVLDLQELGRLHGRQGLLDPAVVLLQELQTSALGLEPALGHVGGLGVVEAALPVRLDELGDELGAADGLLAKLVLVLAVDGPEGLRVGRRELHDAVDKLNFRKVEVRAHQLEVVKNVIVHFLGEGSWRPERGDRQRQQDA